MGQTISRRIVPRLERMQAKYDKEIARQAMEDVDRNKAEAAARNVAAKASASLKKGQTLSTTMYNDPNARVGGFTRGSQYIQVAKDEELSKMVKGGASVPEMPSSLVDFLSDVGPLKKSVNEGLTSGRYLRERDSLSNAFIAERDGRRRRDGIGGALADGSSMAALENETMTEAEQRSQRTLSREGNGVTMERGSEFGNTEDDALLRRFTDEEITSILVDMQQGKKDVGNDEYNIMRNIVAHVCLPTIAHRDPNSAGPIADGDQGKNHNEDEEAHYVAVWPDENLAPYGGVVFPRLGDTQPASGKSEGTSAQMIPTRILEKLKLEEQEEKSSGVQTSEGTSVQGTKNSGQSETR